MACGSFQWFLLLLYWLFLKPRWQNYEWSRRTSAWRTETFVLCVWQGSAVFCCRWLARFVDTGCRQRDKQEPKGGGFLFLCPCISLLAICTRGLKNWIGNLSFIVNFGELDGKAALQVIPCPCVLPTGYFKTMLLLTFLNLIPLTIVKLMCFLFLPLCSSLSWNFSCYATSVLLAFLLNILNLLALNRK